MKKKKISASVHVDPNEIVTRLVGLKDVRILYYGRRGPVGEIAIEQVLIDPRCPRCEGPTRVKDRPVVQYADLPFAGVPMTILWKKHRLVCTNPECPVKSFTRGDHRIAARGCMLTTRAAKWVVKEIGSGQHVSHLAQTLNTSWDSVNTAMRRYGAALITADTKRLKETTAIGLDETLFLREGPFKHKHWSTTVCDVVNNQLIDVIPTRDFPEVARWLHDQPDHVKSRLQYGCLDMSRSYNAVFRVVTPQATRVIDRFHVMRHALLALDECRRRVQQVQLGHRGRSGEPLYKARKLLVIKATASDPELTQRLEGLLALGDPDGEVALAYGVKEAIAPFYETSDGDVAADLLRDIIDQCAKKSSPPELRRLARTLRNWFDQITAWHQARVSNGPTEGMNNLLKRVKRVAFGFTNFENFRIRALLYAGKPNFRLLDSIVVRRWGWPSPLEPEDPLDRIAPVGHERAPLLTARVESGEIILFEHEGRVSGYAVVRPQSFFGCGFVELLAVVAVDRRHGVGGLLLQQAVGLSSTKRIFTSTNRSNAQMIGLLEKEGWQFSGQLEGIDEGDPELVYYKDSA